MTDFTKHSEVLVGLAAVQEAESDLRDNVRESQLFISKRDGQWEPHWYDACDGKPRYTFDITSPVIDQICGEMEQADFDITVRPAGGDTTKDDARLMDGMIRNIENISNASDIYGMATRNMVAGGLDGWQIKQKFIDDDSFDQDLVIEGIANYVDSVWFWPHKKPDASDSPAVVVLEAVERGEYKDRWPDGSGMSVSEDRMSNAYFQKADQVIVGQVYYIKQVNRKLLLTSTGRVIEDSPEIQSILDEMALPGEDGTPGETIVNERMRPKNVVMSRLFDGSDWLGEEQKTVFNHLPVVPLMANFNVIENKVIYWGAVDKLIDPQRVFNYSKSREIEEGALAPRAKFWMTLKQALGFEDTLATLNTNSDPIQLYNPDPEAPGIPGQSGGASINPGLQTISADMRNIVQQSANMYDASMGQGVNSQSGVAIKSLQNKADSGTIKYVKSVERAVARTGLILVDAFPEVYDQQRQVRVLKEDGSFDMKTINEQVFDQQTQTLVTVNDVSKGKYDVVCSAGPAFKNRQDETAAAIIELAAIDPTLVQMGGDVLLNSMSSPGMDLLAERKRQEIFNQGLIPYEQMTDEEKAQAEQAQNQEPQQDPMMVAAQAEAAKAQAANDKIMVEARAIERREARADFETQMKQQKQEFEMSMAAAKSETDREKAIANWQLGHQKLKQAKQKIEQDWQAQQFDQLVTSNQERYKELTAQTSNLKTLREAAGVDSVVTPNVLQAFNNQMHIINDSQREQE